MNKILSLIVVLLLSNSLFSQGEGSQYFVRLMNYRPTGEFGFVMKPANSLELGWQESFEESRTRMKIGLSYLFFKPRLSEFPTQSVTYEYAGTKIYGGNQIFYHFSQIQLSLGFDVAIIDQEKFAIYAGLDVLTGLQFTKYESNDVYTNLHETILGSPLIGFSGRLGFEYHLNDSYSLGFSANRQYFIVTEPRAKLSGNNYGLSLIFNL